MFLQHLRGPFFAFWWARFGGAWAAVWLPLSYIFHFCNPDVFCFGWQFLGFSRISYFCSTTFRSRETWILLLSEFFVLVHCSVFFQIPQAPKEMQNKSLMCKPIMMTKATSCNPIRMTKVTQTGKAIRFRFTTEKLELHSISATVAFQNKHGS